MQNKAIPAHTHQISTNFKVQKIIKWLPVNTSSRFAKLGIHHLFWKNTILHNWRSLVTLPNAMVFLPQRKQFWGRNGWFSHIFLDFHHLYLDPYIIDLQKTLLWVSWYSLNGIKPYTPLHIFLQHYFQDLPLLIHVGLGLLTFNCGSVFSCVNIPQCIYSLPCCSTSRFSNFFTNKAKVNILCTHVAHV